MSDQRSNQASNTKSSLSCPLFGLFMQQQMYSINVELVYINIAKIVSQITPLVYFAYNSSMANSIFFSHSTFINIISKTFSVLVISISDSTMFKSFKSSCHIQAVNTVFSFNEARLLHFTQLGTRVRSKLEMIAAVLTNNKGANLIWKSSNNTLNLAIIDCTFKANNGFSMQIRYIHTVKFTKNLFYNNTIIYREHSLLEISNTTLTFEEGNEFFFNIADVIMDLQLSYMYIKQGGILNISWNSVKSNTAEQRSLVLFRRNSENYFCRFQFLSNKGSLDDYFNNNTINFGLVFNNNHNYTSVLYGTLLNSCQWLPNTAFHTTTPGDVYKRVIQYDTTANIITRQEPTFCYCDKVTGEADCFKDNFTTTPLYAGQIVPINLIQVPTPEITADAAYLWRDVSELKLMQNVLYKPCKLNQYTPSKWSPSDKNVHIRLFYRVLSNYFKTCFACFNARVIAKSTFYCYYLNLKQNCPPGFELLNSSCGCNHHLQVAFPTMTCNIDMETINRPSLSWISYNKEGIISYAVICSILFCVPVPTKLHLNNLHTQCVGHRTGLQCGQCPTGFSAVFGSFNCKKCSNDMLWLLPVFFIAGILLVFCVFTLNLTVVDGKINGFILYANIIVVDIQYALPSHNAILLGLLSLSNLDLGIETCFYHGMTEYDKTWLQFVFPVYLLCIVGVLTTTSRYCNYIERLTRKRVIPVIATIFLLSYSKILLVTAKVLASYTTIHEINGNKTEKTLIWMYDSHLSIRGAKFISLFFTCLLVFLIILVPMNFILIFTKFSYKCNFVSKRLKPYLDAYQAPFKLNHYYYFGIELLVRAILFAIHDVKIGIYQILTIYIGIWIIILIYLCTFKPFKSSRTALLYISYILNIVCLVMLVIFYKINTTNTSYVIIFSALNIIALTEFVCTILYNIYFYHLYNTVKFSTLKEKIVSLISSILKWLVRKPKDSTLDMIPLKRCDQLQELLI